MCTQDVDVCPFSFDSGIIARATLGIILHKSLRLRLLSNSVKYGILPVLLILVNWKQSTLLCQLSVRADNAFKKGGPDLLTESQWCLIVRWTWIINRKLGVLLLVTAFVLQMHTEYTRVEKSFACSQKGTKEDFK